MNELCQRIRASMDSMSVADVHTHLGSFGLRQARNLADIVSYHWLAVELARAAGRKFQSDPRADPIGCVREVLPYFPDVRNTVNHYTFMGILRVLYGITDRTLTEENWECADDMVSGGWWHGFTPTTLLTFFRDRLEMLPSTAWNAFYSDGYIVEWIYGKLLVTKNRLALALSGMVDEGFLTEDDALDIARRLLYANAVASYVM